MFDLLALLRLFGDMQEPLEVLATVGNNLLIEPVVYSYSQFNNNKEVREYYHIYSSREIGRVEFIFDGDTLTGIYGTTPVLFEADPDTVQIETTKDYLAYSEPKMWKVTVWDKLGNSVSDSGISQSTVVFPGLNIDGTSNNVSEEIAFPLILYGTVQRFGIKAIDYKGPVGYSTFVVDLNPEGRDSVVYVDIKQLADQIMEQVVEQAASGKGSATFVSAAILGQTQSITNRLIISMVSFGSMTSVFTLDGNKRLISLLGFKKWIQEIRDATYNGNFAHDPAVYEHYR